MPDGEQERRDAHAAGGQQLRAAACAEFVGDRPGEQHHQRGDQRRGQPQPDQPTTEGHVEGVGEQRGQRRLVGISPCGLRPGAQEVQLVTVVAVPVGHGEQYGREHGTGHRQLTPGRPRGRRGRTTRRIAHRPDPTAPRRDPATPSAAAVIGPEGGATSSATRATTTAMRNRRSPGPYPRGR